MDTKTRATMKRVSSASTCQTTLTRIFERKMNHLLWLAEALLGNPQLAESCVAAALLRAYGAAYVAPDRCELWVSRCVVRDAVNRNCTEIKQIAISYVRDVISKQPSHPDLWNKEDIASLTAAQISESLNVFERAALILHAYLGFSAYDCALLLDCHWSLVEAACSNAIGRIFEKQINARENSAELGSLGVTA